MGPFPKASRQIAADVRHCTGKPASDPGAAARTGLRQSKACRGGVERAPVADRVGGAFRGSKGLPLGCAWLFSTKDEPLAPIEFHPTLSIGTEQPVSLFPKPGGSSINQGR